jgi:orotidine-5'-phosphate decarboxylase
MNHNAERIMVALDYPNADQARALLKELQGIPCYMKVGMELYYAAGPKLIEEMKTAGYKVFLDLKLHDIPNTVKGAARSITSLGVDMFNVHAGGGVQMMAAAREGLESVVNGGANSPLLIAVTVLTSMNQGTLNNEIGVPGSVESTVLNYAKLAKVAGMDGVVASALEVPMIKSANGSGFVTVTPGIRPAGVSADDQSRVMTPAAAVRNGSDYLVIGRAITQAAEPRAALESIVKELDGLE